jgi:hypothetical protein
LSRHGARCRDCCRSVPQADAIITGVNAVLGHRPAEIVGGVRDAVADLQRTFNAKVSELGLLLAAGSDSGSPLRPQPPIGAVVDLSGERPGRSARIWSLAEGHLSEDRPSFALHREVDGEVVRVLHVGVQAGERVPPRGAVVALDQLRMRKPKITELRDYALTPIAGVLAQVLDDTPDDHSKERKRDDNLHNRQVRTEPGDR